MIYILGDSHAEATFRGIEGVVPILVGSVTMYKVGSDPGYKEIIESILSNHGPITDKDMVLFLFGEIDIRYRIKAYTEGFETYQEIRHIVRKYVGLVSSINTPALIGIVSVIPPNRKRDDNAHLIDKDITDEDRIKYTSVMNECIKICCKIEDIFHRIPVLYVDIYSAYKDLSGALPDKISELAGSHVTDQGPARDLLKRLGLIEA